MTPATSTDENRPRPVASTTTVHLDASHVSASDLTSETQARRDLATLTFGDDTTRIVLLGPLDTLQAVVAAASHQLTRIEVHRQITAK